MGRSPNRLTAIMARPIKPTARDSNRKKRRVFDKAYYDRFYGDRQTRVVDEESTARLGAFVCALLEHLEVEVSRVLDVGCGVGLWRDIIAHHFPAASYSGIEVSDYLCRLHGWKQASIADYTARRPFDLVICQGVLQYLSDAEARAAIGNLGELSRGAMFLEVLTREDWDNTADQSVTDDQCYLRNAEWYAKRLRKHFTNCGSGVYLSRRFEHYVYALDRLD
jgi:predicted TPR repeat methyltransferase